MADVDVDALPGQCLAPCMEAVVLKSGLLSLQVALGMEGLHDFPTRANGTPLLMRQGFFQRLTRGDTLQDCAPADVSAAEGDVKHLSLKQLVAIRCNHLDYEPTGANQLSKTNFLKLAEKWTASVLAERILGDEAKLMTEASRAILARHVILTYGAHHQLGEGAEPRGSEWWLLDVAGVNCYLHMPCCESRSDAPGCPVYYGKILTAPNPCGIESESHPSMRWHVQLLEEPEQLELGGASARSGNTPRSTYASICNSSQTSAGQVDNMFDSLLAEIGAVNDQPTESTPRDRLTTTPRGPPQKSGSSPAIFKEQMRAGGPTAAHNEPVATPRTKVFTDLAEAVSSRAPMKYRRAFTLPGATAAAVAPKHVRGHMEPTQNVAVSGASSSEQPKLSASQERLCVALSRFYRANKISDKLDRVDKIALKYPADEVVTLWAALASKYSLPPVTAVQWLARTLDQHVPIQWSKEAVPSTVKTTLEELAQKANIQQDAEGTRAVALSAPRSYNAELRVALDLGNTCTVSALSFNGSCSDPALRPRMWQALLGWQEASRIGDQECDCREGEQELRQRRREYLDLRASLMAEGSSCESSSLLRAKVEGDARSVWRDEAFVALPGVRDAVAAIAFVQAKQCSQYIPGSCELGTVLLYAMSCGGSANLQDAEADAFWCLLQLMAEIQDSIAPDAGLATQIRRTHELLRTYDPPLADVLASHGLGTLPALKFGVALCTRSGFSLADVVRIWDTLLADPQRFVFCDYVVVALLLLVRRDLMLWRADLGRLAEALIAAPKCVDLDSLLRFACAICAFERRCAPGVAHRFPPRPAPGIDILDGSSLATDGLDATLAAAQAQLSSLWDKVRLASNDAWEVGRAAANEAAEQAPTWKAQANFWMAAAVSSAASAAGDVVASAASAAERAATAAGAAATIATSAANKAAEKSQT